MCSYGLNINRKLTRHANLHICIINNIRFLNIAHGILAMSCAIHLSVLTNGKQCWRKWRLPMKWYIFNLAHVPCTFPLPFGKLLPKLDYQIGSFLSSNLILLTIPTVCYKNIETKWTICRAPFYGIYRLRLRYWNTTIVDKIVANYNTFR